MGGCRVKNARLAAQQALCMKSHATRNPFQEGDACEVRRPRSNRAGQIVSLRHDAHVWRREEP